MKYIWQDLPKPLNCFTIRSATMVNLNNNKIVRHYSANTKIVVVQKCVTPNGTYYRTNEAAHHYLNYAFRASAFGLPDEKAPSVPSNSFSPGLSDPEKSRVPAPPSAKKQTPGEKAVPSNDGEEERPRGWLKRLFRRRYGKTKNT